MHRQLCCSLCRGHQHAIAVIGDAAGAITPVPMSFPATRMCAVEAPVISTPGPLLVAETTLLVRLPLVASREFNSELGVADGILCRIQADPVVDEARTTHGGHLDAASAEPDQ